MKNLQKEIAAIESKLDFYETEFDQLNSLLIKCGFPKGIQTLKETALELMEDKQFLNKTKKQHSQ